MEQLTNRRGRRYDLEPLGEIRNPEVGYAAAVLDEARERCVDLIADMSEEAMWTRPAGSPFSAGDLVVHMNWAEFVWLPKLGPHRLSAETVEIVRRGNLKRLYDPDTWTIPVADLVSLCRTTREAVVLPCLKEVGGLDLAVESTQPQGRGPKTVRETLMHVTTSWIYHSGQVGLLTLQNGMDYVWAFE